MDPSVKNKFDSYPDDARGKLLKIREAILRVAEREDIGKITETLKWGEPGYLAVKGSMVRIDWKQKHPDRVSIYFNCNTPLVETFREMYQDTLHFVGNREIAIALSQPIPMAELEVCISMALRYHTIKYLPMLGA